MATSTKGSNTCLCPKLETQSKKHGLYCVSIVLIASVLLFTFTVIEYFELKGKSNGVESVASNHPAGRSSRVSRSINKQQCYLDDDFKFDCHPDEPISKETCQSRGCCWNQGINVSSSPPSCYYPKDFEGYRVIDINQSQGRITVKLERIYESGFPDDIPLVTVYIQGLDNERLRVRVTDSSGDRFEPPIPRLNVSQASTIEAPIYRVNITYDGLLEISRRSTGKVIFQADLRRMIYSNQFIQLSSNLPSKYLFGLGEHFDSFRKQVTWKRLTMFNRGDPPVADLNLYSPVPFYLMIEDDSREMNAHGVYLFNSNAMDVILQPSPAITWRTIGGILDFFIFMGPSAPEVVRQNINLIGKPVMQPYWALGFHICRYGYNSLNKTRETMQRTIDAGIPLDVQWNDIDYMDRQNDFTYDKVNYQGLPQFVDEIHSKGMHYVIILDPGVSAGEKAGTYPPWEEGVRDDIFVKDISGDIFIGLVWNPSSTAFPDFTNPKTKDYWTRQFYNLSQQFHFDGAWIDMNEPSNFLDGQADGCYDTTLDNPPYTPRGQPLRTTTLCMSAKHYAGSHYDLHNLYSLYENIATFEAMRNVTGKRSLILSRSTFPGQGHYASHWSGDILSTWEHMRYSISNMLEFNIYGIPMIGSDICGFKLNTTIDLCSRWSALGAFYPFSRNHNSNDTNEQDPAFLGPKVVAAAKYALDYRYKLLPYLYTLFFKANTQGDTVVRPLFFEFPGDEAVYSIETQFMWGSGLMVVPVLQPETRKVDAYFPKGVWYDLSTQKVFLKSSGVNRTIHIDDDKIGLYLRGGNIIPTYLNSSMTTTELRKQDVFLMVAPDENGHAYGEYFSDGGESLDSIDRGNYTLVQCMIETIELTCYVNQGNYADGLRLGGVIIMGVEQRPSDVTVNGRSEALSIYNESSQTLTLPLAKDWDISKPLRVKYFY